MPRPRGVPKTHARRLDVFTADLRRESKILQPVMVGKKVTPHARRPKMVEAKQITAVG